MPFSPSKNFVFIHVTKTAGSSINNFFVENLGRHDYLFTGQTNHEINYFVGFDQHQGMEHLSASQMQKILGREKYHQCFKFTFVRNPFDRLVSTYFWKKENPFIEQEVRDYFNQCTFEEFVLDGKTHLPSPMHYWICNQNKKPMVDFVGRFENLHADFEKLCSRLNIKNKSLPHAYKTNHKPYRDYYNQALINKVTAVYKDDLEIFNYKF